MNIYSNIKKCRLLKKFTQKQMSEILDINIRTYQKYESGDITPNMDTLKRIADSLEVDIDILIHGVSYEIYDRSDVFKLYSQLNTKTKLSKFLGFNSDFNMEFEMFKTGLLSDYSLYTKVADFLGLNEEQLFRWYMSDFLYELLKFDDFGVSDLSHDDFKYIFDNNILEKQTFNSLNTDGLSENNKNKLKNYIDNRTLIKIDKMRSKKGYKPLGKTKKLGPIKVDPSVKLLEYLDVLALNDELADKVDKIKLLAPILDFYGIKLTLSDDKKYITMDIPNKDIYKDIHLEDFLNFINKIYWGIEREIDYLEHLYD